MAISRHSAETLIETFKDILDQAGHPEAINDGYDSCPSRRICGVVVTYKKRVHGPIVTSRLGLDVLRQQCDHLAQRSKELLESYRRGEPVPAGCPLRGALALDEGAV